jgi:hypothetical protein
VQSPIAAGLGVSLLPRSRSARRGATTSRCGAWRRAGADGRGRHAGGRRRPPAVTAMLAALRAAADELAAAPEAVALRVSASEPPPVLQAAP